MNGTPALPFDEAEIRAAFDAASFQRGRDYARHGAVRALELAADGHELSGLVQGTTPQPYRVQVTVGGGRGRRIIGTCSCPVGNQCKHAAALMLAALRTRRHPRHRRRAHRPIRWRARSGTGCLA